MKRKGLRLKKPVKIFLCGIVAVSCFVCAKDVYAEYNPFSSITDISEPNKTIKYNALDHTFLDGNDEVIKDTSFIVQDGNEEHEILSDSNGVLYKGWLQKDDKKYFYDDNGYLLKESQTIHGTYYMIHEDGSLYNNEWFEDCWYTNGIVDGQDADTLVFVEGEKGFYYLEKDKDGKKAINTTKTLSDGREVRFDEEGHIVSEEIYVDGMYYFPPHEFNEESSETYSVRVGEYNDVIEHDVKLINHRGYHVDKTENTLAAYQKSQEKGYRYVEVDVQMTSDNVPVLIHNGTLSALAGVNVAIDSITLEEAKTYSLRGETITTLEEFVAYCKANSITPYIELKNETIKTSEQVEIIYNVVNKYGMIGKIEWISFSPSLLQYIWQFDTNDPMGYVVGRVSDYQNILNQAEGLKESGMNVFIDSHISNVDGLLEGCRERNIPLEVWTVNDEDKLNALDEYISGVTTDTITN